LLSDQRQRVMNPKKATIIYNPMSGRPARRAEDVRRMIGLLGERGIDADAGATAGSEDATRLASEAVANRVGIIVSYGGDGTLNEVIQGMAGSGTNLAVWAGGTSNVVARDLGVPFDLVGLADMIATGKTKRIALGVAQSADSEGQGSRGAGELGGRAEYQSPDASAPLLPCSPAPLRAGFSKRYFVMMAGVGLDASVARSVNKKLKRRTGELAYWVSGLKHLFSWRREPFTIEVDGRRYESAFALIGNGKGYGGGMMLTPGAKLEEPRFEVFVLPLLPNNFAYLRALGGCLRGRPEIAGAILVRGTHITANSAHEPWVEADGEIIGPLPMTFDIVPDALSVIVP
jgi:diacylglycerol kinase (ATP)